MQIITEPSPFFTVGKSEYEWKIQIAELRKMNVAIGVVGYDFTHKTNCKNSILAVHDKFTELGISHGILDIGNESCVPRARNMFSAMTLQGGFTHFLSVDADVGFNAMDIVCMLAMNVGIVGIVYPKKGINWTKAFLYFQEHQARLQNLKPEELAVELEAHSLDYVLTKDKEPVKCNGGISVGFLGDGMILVNTRALNTMDERGVVDKINNPISDDLRRYYFGFFNESVVNGEHLTCDYALCDRWRRCGGKVYAYPPGSVQHLGSMIFRGGPVLTW